MLLPHSSMCLREDFLSHLLIPPSTFIFPLQVGTENLAARKSDAAETPIW